MNQANAILRHLGRQFKFYDSKNLKESYLVDWALETSLDLWNTKAYRRWFGSSADKQLDDQAIQDFSKFNT